MLFLSSLTQQESILQKKEERGVRQSQHWEAGRRRTSLLLLGCSAGLTWHIHWFPSNNQLPPDPWTPWNSSSEASDLRVPPRWKFLWKQHPARILSVKSLGTCVEKDDRFFKDPVFCSLFFLMCGEVHLPNESLSLIESAGLFDD